MLLLAADTSGKQGSVALARCQHGGNCEVIEVVPLHGGTFSAQLVPQVAALLATYGFSKADIGGFAVASGPGSFTGLRVGLAAIKALAEVLHKPIAAVSLLEVVARSGPGGERALAALDAGRGEVYAGEYDLASGRAKMLQERLLGPAEFVKLARGLLVITPDKVLAEMALSEGLRVLQIERPRSDAIARFGWEKIQSGEIVAPDDLEANYIRRTDAEIFSKPGN